MPYGRGGSSPLLGTTEKPELVSSGFLFCNGLFLSFDGRKTGIFLQNAAQPFGKRYRWLKL